MPVDISSFHVAQPAAPQNPLQMAQGLAQIQHSIASTQNLRNTNAQFQQQFAARQAMGPLLQQSIDPQTGEWDINKFAILASKNPAVSWMLPDIISQAEQRKLTQAQTVLAHIKADMDRNELRGQAASAALAMTKQGVPIGTALTRALSDPQASRNLFPGGMKEAASFIADMSKLSPQEQQQKLTQIALQSKKDSDMQKLLFPEPKEVDLGGQKQFVQASPMTGAVSPMQGGTFVQQPTVAEMMSPIKSVGPGGQETTIPAYAQPGGIKLPGGGTAPGTGGMPAAGANVPGQPLASQAPPAAIPNNGATPPPAPSVGTGVAPAAGATLPNAVPFANAQVPGTPPPRTTNIGEYQKGMLKEHLESYVKPLMEQSRASQGLLNMLSNIDRIQHEAGGKLTGPGTEAKQQLGQMLMALGMPESRANQLFGTNVSSLQDLQKNLLMGLAEYMKANFPTRYTQMEWTKMASEGYLSRQMTERAFNDVKKFMRDVAMLKRTEYKAYLDWKDSGEDPLQFSSQWAPIADRIMSSRK